MRRVTFFLILCVAVTKATGQRNFHPDGYYFPNSQVKKGDWNFEWLGIMIETTKESENFVSVRFRNVKTDKWIDVETKKYYIKHDSTSIVFNNKLIGEFTINGHFTHSKAPYDDKEMTSKTVVFIGFYKLNKKSFPVGFTWGEGD